MKNRLTISVLAACVVSILAIGWLDYITGREVSLSFFYLLPIIVATITGGRRSGAAMAVLSTATQTIINWPSGNLATHSMLLVWNIGIRLCSFLTVAYLGGWLPWRNATVPQKGEKSPRSGSTHETVPYKNLLPPSNKVGRLLWTIAWGLLFRPTPMFLHAWRAFLLRCFGAHVGRKCAIDPSCRIWAPWNLEIGDDCQVDAHVDCYSVARITVEDRTIIGQGAYLCSASHDFTDPAFPLTHAPIRVGPDAWVAARAFIRPGIVVGRGAMVGVCAVVTRDVEPWTVVAGNPARLVKRRNAEESKDGLVRETDGTIGRRVKAGILTFHWAENYGAILQVYALQTALERIGCDVKIIDYQPDYLMNGGRWLWPVSRRNLYADAGILLLRTKWIRSLVTGRKRHLRFEDFRARYLRFTARKYQTLQELRERLPVFDMLVCGSDQIWNPPLRFGVDPAFYLTFGPRTCRRVSFAPSFGSATIDPDYREEIKQLLSNLDAISVRERSGVDIVEELAGRRAAWMPDPTLLLVDYENIMIKPVETGFIFTYALRSGRPIEHIKRLVAKHLGLPIIKPVNPEVHWLSRGRRVQIGPSRWLGYLANANVVITNSFHGTVFSILFKKQFIAVDISGRNSSLNERTTSLLDRLGLSGRFVSADTNDDEVLRLVHEPIPWDEVHVRIQAWRAEAWAYLRMEVAAAQLGAHEDTGLAP